MALPPMVAPALAQLAQPVARVVPERVSPGEGGSDIGTYFRV